MRQKTLNGLKLPVLSPYLRGIFILTEHDVPVWCPSLTNHRITNSGSPDSYSSPNVSFVFGRSPQDHLSPLRGGSPRPTPFSFACLDEVMPFRSLRDQSQSVRGRCQGKRDSQC